jgi:hypothetical protein
LHRIALRCITLHCITSHRIALHRIAPHRIALHRIASHRIASHRIALHCIASHHIASHHIASHRITLHRTALHRAALHRIVLHIHSSYSFSFFLFLFYLLQSQRTRLFAAEGSKEAEEWLSCKVLSNVADGTGLRLIGVAIGDPSVAAAYTTPGQYLKLKTDAGPDTKAAFLAIASPPSQQGAFSFLVKETDSNAALTGAAPGSSVLVTRPMGNGFKIAEAFEGYRNDFPVNNVLLLACGSGLAPIAAAIEVCLYF